MADESCLGDWLSVCSQQQILCVESYYRVEEEGTVWCHCHQEKMLLAQACPRRQDHPTLG